MSERLSPGCFCCGRKLENIGNPGGNQPSKGLEFTSGGHYGCTVFDPMDSSFLALNICDPCLTEKSKAGFLLRGERIIERYANTKYQVAIVGNPQHHEGKK